MANDNDLVTSFGDFERILLTGDGDVSDNDNVALAYGFDAEYNDIAEHNDATLPFGDANTYDNLARFTFGG